MTARAATRLVLLFGIVSLFADMTYEGARSISGPLLATLGASATAVGFAAGFGEFTAYSLRLFSGWLADRTQAYWTLTFAGYVVNLVAVPLLAFAERWETVVLLLIAERAGKALRAPARDAILSQAASPIGTGWAFGLHELLDQTGAILGPVAIALLSVRGSLREALLWLAIPAALAIVALMLAKRVTPPLPARARGATAAATRWTPRFGAVLVAGGLMGAGIADFTLIAFHLKTTGLLADSRIALTYACAQFGDALSALTLGRAFDRFGPRTLVVGAALGAIASALAFSTTAATAVGGAVLWGLALGVHGAVLKAAVTSVTPEEGRASAFGVFHSAYGLMGFGGTMLVAWLYQQSPAAAATASAVLQMAAIPVILRLSTPPSLPRPAA